MALPSRLTVGTMNFGRRTPAAEAQRIVDRAIERGATFFDTANVYGDGESESVLGAALGRRHGQVGIATKVGLLRRGGKVEGLSFSRVTESLAESLKRLRCDRVDVYYLHAPDPLTPFAETLDALQGLLEQGRIGAWGVSNFAAWQILELQRLCDTRVMARPAVSQVLYNLLVRQLDVEYFAFAVRHPIHTTVYNPLAGGLLALEGHAALPSSRLETNPLYRRRYGSEAFAELARRFFALAGDYGLSSTTLAYAFCAGTSGVDSTLAGPGELAHLDAALDGVATTLSAECRAAIDHLHRSALGTDACYAR